MQFPLQFQFKITTLANDFVATDASGQVVAYVREKMFRLVEEVQVFADESRQTLRYTIRANQWLDFSASYGFTDAQGRALGRVARRGWASLWRARYELHDEREQPDLLLQEENAWVKVLDGLLGDVPVLGVLTGYVFNPSYLAARPDGTPVARLRKEPSFFGRRFSLSQLAPFEPGEQERLLLGCMMMVLLERRRG